LKFIDQRVALVHPIPVTNIEKVPFALCAPALSSEQEYLLVTSALIASFDCAEAERYPLAATSHPVPIVEKVPHVAYSNAELAVFTSAHVGATEKVAQITSSQNTGLFPVTIMESGQTIKSSRFMMPLYVVFGLMLIRCVRVPLPAVAVPSGVANW
jgi:hypothetical protein